MPTEKEKQPPQDSQNSQQKDKSQQNISKGMTGDEMTIIDYMGESIYTDEWNLMYTLKFMGSGLLVSIAYMDPGNIAGDIQSGYMAKYELLQTLVISLILAYTFQLLAAKVGIISGSDIGYLVRRHFPGYQCYIIWFMCEVSIISVDIQAVLASSIAQNILFGYALWIGVIVTIVDTLLILVFELMIGFKFLKILVAIMVSFLSICYLANFFEAEKDMTQVLRAFFWTDIPQESHATALGLIGSILMPYNLYLHSSLSKKHVQVRTDQREIKKAFFFLNMEAAFSFFFTVLLNMIIIVTFAQFSGTPVEPNLDNAGQLFEQTLGPFGKYVWGAGLLASSQSTVLVGSLAGQFVMEGFLNLKMKKYERALITRTIALIPSLILVHINLDSQSVNQYINILQIIQLPFGLIPLLKLSKNQSIMKNHKLDEFQYNLFAGIATSLILFNFYTLYEELLQYDHAYLTTIMTILSIVYFYCLYLILKQDLLFEYQEIAQKNSPIDSEEDC